MKPNDGGPAFARPIGTVLKRFNSEQSGMSLRDYFIAHAPVEPQGWFQPAIPPKPERDPKLQWCNGCKRDACCEGNADCEQLRAFREKLQDWSDLRDKARLIQWPAAWADEMLKAREQ